MDRIRHWGISIGILGVLDILVQVEAQPIPTLMTHRQVGKDEVTSLARTIQVGDTGHRHTRQHRACGRTSHPSMSDGTRRFERREQEEVGIVSKGNIRFV